jgi:hypothetical protein
MGGWEARRRLTTGGRALAVLLLCDKGHFRLTAVGFTFVDRME